jgi:hypothetical protein
MAQQTILERNELLANNIKDWLIKNHVTTDVRIYFNNKAYCWSSFNGFVEPAKPNVLEDIESTEYFEYGNDETVSMSFEGGLYDIINGYESPSKLEKFDKIFKKHNCYYELGYAWSLSVYYD